MVSLAFARLVDACIWIVARTSEIPHVSEQVPFRILHSQIAEYNRLGVRVRYLFFPRSGPDTDSWHKAEAVWCSSNRNDALTRAKNGEDIKASKCPTDVISRDWDLGHKLAVEGTPAIFLPSGEMLPGYAPPTQLAHYLKTGQM